MIDHPKCESCKHWEKPQDGWGEHPVQSVVGRCKKVPHSTDMDAWDEEFTTNVLKPEYKGFLAVVMDGSGYHASLNPTVDFYCPLHSELDGHHKDDTLIPPGSRVRRHAEPNRHGRAIFTKGKLVWVEWSDGIEQLVYSGGLERVS